MNKYIGLTAFVKIDTLIKTLERLENCTNINNYNLIILLDSTQNMRYHCDIENYIIYNNKIAKYLESYQNFKKHIYKSITVLKSDQNLGTFETCGSIMNFMFSYTDFALYIEDDMLLNKDALIFLETIQKLFPEEFTYGLSPIFEHPNINENNIKFYLDKIHRIPWIESSNFAISKENWNKIKDIRSNVLGDFNLGCYIRNNNLTTLCPMITRSERIGIDHDLCFSKACNSTNKVNSYTKFTSKNYNNTIEVYNLM